MSIKIKHLQNRVLYFLPKFQWIFVLLFLSLLLRVLIFYQIRTTTPFSDYFDYKSWVYKSYSLGLNKTYWVPPKGEISEVNQPPGSIYILRGSFEVFLQTTKVVMHIMHLKPGTLWIADVLLVFFLRLPSIIADLLLGFLIYFLLKDKVSEKIMLIASALYLFSPLVIYNSTVWGQMDSINNVLFYISLVFFFKRKSFLSVLFYGLSLFVKLSLLPLAPLYVCIALFGGYFSKKSFLISSGVTAIIILLLSLPFFSNPLLFIEFLIKASSGQSQAITVNAFNFWWFVFNPAVRIPPPDITAVFYGLSLNMWGNTLFALSYIPVLFTLVNVIKKKSLTSEFIFLCFALIAFATFLFLPKMHERYLYPVFPLFITWVAYKQKYWMQYILLSTIHFMNLYIVWNPNLFLFGTFEGIMQSQAALDIYTVTTFVVFGFLYKKLFFYKIKFLSTA